jgi:hypothetical protein
VSATVIQEALESPARSTSRASSRKPSWPGDQQTHELPLGDDDAEGPHQRERPRHRDLPLMDIERAKRGAGPARNAR